MSEAGGALVTFGCMRPATKWLALHEAPIEIESCRLAAVNLALSLTA